MSALKKNLISIGAVLILALSVVAFVFIPALGGSSAGKTISFGEWDGKPIEYAQDTYLVRQIQTISDQVESQGQEINQFTYYQIMQSAFRSAAVRMAVLDSLEEVNYRLPRSIVDKNLVSYYLDESGRYSAKKFNETPETTRAGYRAVVTEELTAQRYLQDTLGTAVPYDGENTLVYGLKTSTKETELIKSMTGPERSFEYVAFNTADYPEAEAAAWGRENSALFVKHSFSVITSDQEAVVKKAAAAVASGESTFEDAVATWSTKAGTDATGKLLKSYRADINQLFTDAADLEKVLALAAGQTSEVIKAGSDFAIVRCDADPVQPDFSDKALLSAVNSWMKINEKGRIEDYFVARASSFAAQARTSGFDAAASSFGIEKKTTPSFTINIGNLEIMSGIPSDSNPELSAAVSDELFYKTAFSLASGAVSEPVALGSYTVVLKLLEEKATDSQMLEMVPLFYNYYATNWAQETLSNMVLADKRFKDDFMTTYLEYFLN